jgi:2,3-bisphosphoglycerate-independent phosphoglycerate mutase
MHLLPGSLPTDLATLNALCENLPSHSELAKWLRACEVETVDESWSDWERGLLLLIQGERRHTCRQACRREEDGVRLTSKEPHPHPNPPLEGEGTKPAIATPLHATLGLTDLTPLDPSQLQLSGDDSRTLCEACDAHLREDGVRLEFVNVSEWRVVTEREIKVLTERPDWIIGESMRPNLPRGEDGRLVERWMNELQMLLFNHPVNAARAEQRLPPVNVVWLWGFDGLPRGPGDHADARMLKALRDGSVVSWQRAWDELESKILASDGIVVGDARPRLKLTKRKRGLVESLRIKLANPKLNDVLAALQTKMAE